MLASKGILTPGKVLKDIAIGQDDSSRFLKNQPKDKNDSLPMNETCLLNINFTIPIFLNFITTVLFVLRFVSRQLFN